MARFLVLVDESGDRKRWRRHVVDADNAVAALHSVAAPNYSNNYALLEWGPHAEVYELARSPKLFQCRTSWQEEQP